MPLFFTTDNLHSNIVEISDDARITQINVKAWAGQAGESEFFCIGNDGSSDLDLTLWADSPDIELSSDGRNWFQGLDYSVQAGRVGDAVFIRAIADLDALEGTRLSKIHVNGTSLPVCYFLAEANRGDTDRSQAFRFTGENTREIAEFFGTDAESLDIREYEPQTKPVGESSTVKTLLDIKNRTIREWVNPLNKVVGFKTFRWATKGFIGDRDQIKNNLYDLKEIDFQFKDSNSVILPADFEGFTPTWRKHIVPFGVEGFFTVNPWCPKFQGTVWTLLRDNQEYALRNIRRAGFFKGQILFWTADLERISYPAEIQDQGFLPWNELLDSSWKPIDYVRSWSTTPQESEYVYVI